MFLLDSLQDFEGLEGLDNIGESLDYSSAVEGLEGFGGVLGGILALGIVIIFIVAIIGLALYIVNGIFCNKYNKLLTGQGTALAWIPFANMYLLGKLAWGKVGGWLLLAGIIISCTNILGNTLSGIVSSIYGIATLVAFIMMLVNYSNEKKRQSENPQQNIK